MAEKTKTAAPLYTIKRRVVVPTLKLKSDEPAFVKFLAPILHKKKTEQEKQPDGTMKDVEKEIEIARVANLETGEEVEFVVGSVLLSDLNEAYPNDGYNGLSFRIVKHDVAGKRYKSYEIDEIEYTPPVK